MKTAQKTKPKSVEQARPLRETMSFPPVLVPKTVVDTDPSSLKDTDGGFLKEILADLTKQDYAHAIETVLTHLKIHKNHPPLLNFLAALQFQAGKVDESETTLMRIPRTAETDSKMANNLACIQLARQANSTAQILLNGTLKRGSTPGFPEFHYNLGLALMNEGKNDLALAAFRQSIDRAPMVEAVVGAALSAFRQRRFAEAEQILGQHLQVFPNAPVLKFFLSGFCQVQNKWRDAIALALLCILAEPTNPYYAIRYTEVCKHLRFDGFNPNHHQAHIHALSAPLLNRSHLAQSWAFLLITMPGWKESIPQSEVFDSSAARGLIETLTETGALTDPFLILGLREIILRTPQLEIILTAIRRSYLEKISNTPDAIDDSDRLFLSALARQCFQNEYAWYITPEEQGLIDDLKRKESDDPARLLILACYDRITCFAPIDSLKEKESDPLFTLLVRDQVLNIECEREILKKIPQLTPVDDATSKAVEQMYAENPYPRWTSINYAGDPTILKLDPNQKNRTQVLIAGCGTGFHPTMVAVTYENVQVTAIDLSLPSLAYAIRKTQEIGIPNIEFAQADILELASTPRMFDCIESAGVLHHLKDPMKGLEILLNLLKPGGKIRLGLYSSRARIAMTAGRTIVENEKYPSTPEGIREFRHDIFTKFKDHPAGQMMRNGDFFTISTCRDMAFHVQEQCYSIQDLKEILKRFNLEFLGFLIDSLRLVEFQKIYPTPTDALNLDNWEAFEADFPDTFANMYQFWARKP